MDSPFVIEQLYEAPIENVWQALSEMENMKKWYFPQITAFEAVPGFQFRFADDGSEFKKEWLVTRVDPGRLLAHTWTYTGYPGSSEVIFQLSEEAGKTKLTLTHTGLASFPADPHFARQRFENGWKTILGVNLKNFLTENLHSQ